MSSPTSQPSSAEKTFASVASIVSLADLLAVGVERHLAAFAQAAAGVGELHAHLMLAGWNRRGRFDHEVLEATPVVAVLELAALGVETPAADVRALGDDDALGSLLRHHDLGRDGVRLVLDAQDAVLRQASHAAEQNLGLSFDQHRAAGQVRVDSLEQPVVDRQHVVARRFDEPEALQLVELLRHLLGEVLRLAPVLSGVVELPDVIVQRRWLFLRPRVGVPRHRRPPLMVDATVAEHLEILRLVPLRRLGVVERVEHADAFDRRLRQTVHRKRFGYAGRFENRRSDVDDVAELRANFALGLDALRPVDDGAVAGAAPVRGDLLGPLVRRVHRVRPADGVVVVRLGSTELVDPRREVFGRLERLQTVEVAHLVVAAVERSFGGGAVVAGDVVDERVVGDAQLGQ